MSSGTSSEGAPAQIAIPDSERAGLLSTLNDWLAVIEGVLASEIGEEQRKELAKGAAELRVMVDGMFKESTDSNDN